MKMVITDGRLSVTDYRESEDYSLGRPWCCMHGNVYHVVLPHIPQHCSYHQAAMWPVGASEEPERWQYRLVVDRSLDLRLPVSCFVGRCKPMLLDPGRSEKRKLVLYHPLPANLAGKRPEWGFGLLDGDGVPTLGECPLLVFRVDYRDPEMQRIIPCLVFPDWIDLPALPPQP